MKSIFVLQLLLISLVSFGQNNVELYNLQVEKAKRIDYLNFNYQYLDDSFRPKISSQVFDSLANANNFYMDRINSYEDSLAVALCGEFKTWPERNIAHHRITMTWKRISYILWLDEDEASKLGASYNFSMPYELYEYFYKLPEKWDDRMHNFVEDYRMRVYKGTQDDKVKTMSYKELFNFGLVENPTRKRDYEQLVKERGTGTISCGEPNCCQTIGTDECKK